MAETSFDPLDVRHCLCGNLRKATRAVTQLYDNALRQDDLTAAQFNMLAAMDIVGVQTVSRLAEVLGLDRTTLSRNLQPLERRGLIAGQAGSDGRVREVALSPAGQALLKQARARWQAVQHAMVDRLGVKDVQALLAALNDVAEEVGQARS